MYAELTLGCVRNKWFVDKTENLGDIIEIGMLGNKRPLRVVRSIVEICDGDLNSPILLVVELDMPMNSNWAHVLCALKQWGVVFSMVV